jgi:hypothetical protein
MRIKRDLLTDSAAFFYNIAPFPLPNICKYNKKNSLSYVVYIIKKDIRRLENDVHTTVSRVILFSKSIGAF